MGAIVVGASSSSAMMALGKGDPHKAAAYTSMIAAFLAGRPENTRRSYRCALGQFFNLYAWICPEDVLPVHAAGFKVWLVERKKVSDATAYNRISAVTSFFDYLCTPQSTMENPLIRYNPFKHIPKNDIQPTPYGKSTAMEWETFQRIIGAIPSDAMGLRDRAILLFFAFTGRRRQEVAQLLVKDLHINDAKPWYHARVKGGALKRFELPALCADAIKAYWIAADRLRDLAPDQGVFSSLADDHLNAHLAKNRPLANRTMNEILSRAAHRAGLDPLQPGICIHAMRHMAARDLNKAGARLQDIQQFLGHENPATTQIYLGQLAGPAPAMTDALVKIRDGAQRYVTQAVR